MLPLDIPGWVFRRAVFEQSRDGSVDKNINRGAPTPLGRGFFNIRGVLRARCRRSLGSGFFSTWLHFFGLFEDESAEDVFACPQAEKLVFEDVVVLEISDGAKEDADGGRVELGVLAPDLNGTAEGGFEVEAEQGRQIASGPDGGLVLW